MFSKTLIKMAKLDLKFLACDCDDTKISVMANAGNEDIVITTASDDGMITICLDKSTSIKFAKTLRTEINKIKD